MKKTFLITTIAALVSLGSCKEKSGYYDLNNKRPVTLVKDEETGLLVDAETKKPVAIYVNEATMDTISGETGKIINGQLIKLEDGKYKYDGLKVKLDEDGDFKLKDGDYKRKVDADGDIKIKDGDSKKKIDGETGEEKKR